MAAPTLSVSAFVALSSHWHAPQHHFAELWALYKASRSCCDQENSVLRKQGVLYHHTLQGIVLNGLFYQYWET